MKPTVPRWTLGQSKRRGAVVHGAVFIEEILSGGNIFAVGARRPHRSAHRLADGCG